MGSHQETETTAGTISAYQEIGQELDQKSRGKDIKYLPYISSKFLNLTRAKLH